MPTYQAVLDALGDPTRLRLVEALRSGPASVGQLAAKVPVSRPAVSQHLRVLHRTGLVAYESAGTRNVYRLDPAGLTALRRWVDEFWGAALAQFAEYATAVAEEEST